MKEWQGRGGSPPPEGTRHFERQRKKIGAFISMAPSKARYLTGVLFFELFAGFLKTVMNIFHERLGRSFHNRWRHLLVRTCKCQTYWYQVSFAGLRPGRTYQQKGPLSFFRGCKLDLFRFSSTPVIRRTLTGFKSNFVQGSQASPLSSEPEKAQRSIVNNTGCQPVSHAANWITVSSLQEAPGLDVPHSTKVSVFLTSYQRGARTKTK